MHALPYLGVRGHIGLCEGIEKSRRGRVEKEYLLQVLSCFYLLSSNSTYKILGEEQLEMKGVVVVLLRYVLFV